MRIADEKVNPFKSHESHKNCFQKVVKLDCKDTVSSTAVAGPKDKPPKISMELALEKNPQTELEPLVARHMVRPWVCPDETW